MIKNDAIRISAIMDNNIPNGTSLNTPKSCVSGVILNNSGCFFPVSIPKTPNTLNQIKLTIAGTSNTPEMNSRIERPLDTRAINTPTNGLQLNHQPQ